MTLQGLLAAVFGAVMVSTASAQAPSPPPQLNAVTHTAYSKNTELFAEWRPLIVGEATRLTAHLTRTSGDGFKPYAEGKVTITLTVEAVVANAAADGPERPGVFRLNVTPQKSGTGRLVIDVSAATSDQHFVIDKCPRLRQRRGSARAAVAPGNRADQLREGAFVGTGLRHGTADRALPWRRADLHGAGHRDRARRRDRPRLRSTNAGAFRVARDTDAPHGRRQCRGDCWLA